MNWFKRKAAPTPRLTISFCKVLGVVDNHGYPVLSQPIIPWHTVRIEPNRSNLFDPPKGEPHEPQVHSSQSEPALA